jgi:hypothetical protein
MPKGKIRYLVQEKTEYKQKLEKDWQDFLEKDTYLIFDDKQQYGTFRRWLALIPGYENDHKK